MCRGLLIVLAVFGILAGGSAAHGEVVADGLVCDLDFQDDSHQSGDTWTDATGNGNNATLQNGAFFNAVGGYWGDAVQLAGGWIDIDPTGGINALATGTVELFIRDMPMGLFGCPMQWSDVAGDGYNSGFELWADRRTHANGRHAYFGGRSGGVEQFSGDVPASLWQDYRDQWVLRFDGTSAELYMRTYNYLGTAGEIDETTEHKIAVAAGGREFLMGVALGRIGARNDEDAGGPSSIMPAATHAETLRVYDRVLTDTELAENWLTAHGLGTQEKLPGDANFDGIVTDADLSLLLANWNQDATGDADGGWGRGEFDGTAPVQDADLSLLLANWTVAGQARLPAAGGQVPEPASALVLLLGFAGAALRRGRN